MSLLSGDHDNGFPLEHNHFSFKVGYSRVPQSLPAHDIFSANNNIFQHPNTFTISGGGGGRERELLASFNCGHP